MSIMNKITAFLRSPQGQRASAKAQQMARDPRTRQRATSVLGRLRKR